MRLRRPIAFILSAAVAASALTGCDSFSGHAAAAANSAQVQQLIEFIADLGLERDLRQALQKGGDLRQALLTLLGLENAVNFNVDGLTSARPGQHAVQVWEVTAQSAEDAAALAASQIRAVLEQLKSSGVTEGRIGMVEVDGKYYVVVDVEVTEENTFEPIRPASDDDDDSDDDNEDTSSVPAKGVKTADGKTFDVSELSGEINVQAVLEIINKVPSDGKTYNEDDITELDLSGCTSLTTISQSAFERCKNLKTVTLPKGLQSIGTGAFDSCESLKTVTLPSSVTTIDKWAFGNCTSLEEINLSDCINLQTIGNRAFWYCTSLTSIDLSNTSVTTIPYGTFAYCHNLTEVRLPKDLTTIEGSTLDSYYNGAFAYCRGLTDIYFYGTVVPEIRDGAFDGVILEGRTTPLTIHYPSSWNIEALQKQLEIGSLTLDEKLVKFEENPSPNTLTSFLGF